MTVDPARLYALTESISKTAHRETESEAALTQFAQAVKQEEVALGVSQDRERVGFSTDIAYYDMLATGSPNFHAIFSGYVSLLEALLRIGQNRTGPTKILVDDLHFRWVVQSSFNAQLFVKNSIHVDYVERHGNIHPGTQYQVISQADFEQGVFPAALDIIMLEARDASRDEALVDAALGCLKPGGMLLITHSLDQGRFAMFGENHDFYPMFANLIERPNIRVYHIPISLGVTVVTTM